jgi:hypothetical protein
MVSGAGGFDVAVARSAGAPAQRQGAGAHRPARIARGPTAGVHITIGHRAEGGVVRGDDGVSQRGDRVVQVGGADFRCGLSGRGNGEG